MAKKKDTAMAIVRDLAKVNLEEEIEACHSALEKYDRLNCRAKALLKQAKKGKK